jgi:SpoVK/Ycf46/Vps4 family AAA+-type ATPase
MTELHLLETIHPTREGTAAFDGLLGIDTLKEALTDELMLILDRKRLEAWTQKHHNRGLGILDITKATLPLILMSGDVGCGKTALASCVATPVARALDQRIVCLETPSDIRGNGHVGELSARITEAFTQAKARAAAVGRAILVIDEADDLATSRSQMQAHHEDRSGVNVLIKEINHLAGSKAPVALIMITNRANALDPAVLRRAALRLSFERPNDKARSAVFQRILSGTQTPESQIAELVKLTASEVPFTYSDLTDRIARLALRRSWKANQPFGFAALKAAIADTEPSPLMDSPSSS